MRSHEVTVGRTVMVALEHGEDFFDGLERACRAHGIRQGYLPLFLGAMSAVEIVGTCEQVADPSRPIFTPVYLSGVDVVGAGTIAYDDENASLTPHVHLSAGVRGYSADGRTSHLLRGTVQFLAELVIVEVAAPRLRRVNDPGLYDLSVLTFDSVTDPQAGLRRYPPLR